MLGLCQRRPCGVEKLLLPDENPHVEREPLRRTASGKNSDPEGWLLKHHKAYSQIRLTMDTPSPHDATTSSSWFQTLTGCQRSCLIYQHHKLQSSMRAVIGHQTALGKGRRPNRCPTLLLDVDQSVDTTFKSTNGGEITIAPCMMPAQKLWVHAPDGAERLLLGREALVLQAFPVALAEEHLNKVSDAFESDLAGNAMSFLVLLAVAQSGFAPLFWREQSVDEDLGAASMQDVDEAEGLLSMLSIT